MKIAEKFFRRVENTVGKGEIARNEQFLLFPQCFQGTRETRDCLEIGQSFNALLLFQHMAVEGALVSTANLHASNGIVHIINRVMQPPNGTIVEILMRTPQFSALANLVQAAGLTNALTGDC